VIMETLVCTKHWFR